MSLFFRPLLVLVFILPICLFLTPSLLPHSECKRVCMSLSVCMCVCAFLTTKCSVKHTHKQSFTRYCKQYIKNKVTSWEESAIQSRYLTPHKWHSGLQTKWHGRDWRVDNGHFSLRHVTNTARHACCSRFLQAAVSTCTHKHSVTVTFTSLICTRVKRHQVASISGRNWTNRKQSGTGDTTFIHPLRHQQQPITSPTSPLIISLKAK